MLMSDPIIQTVITSITAFLSVIMPSILNKVIKSNHMENKRNWAIVKGNIRILKREVKELKLFAEARGKQSDLS